MTHLDRREALALLAGAPLATAFQWAPDAVREDAARAREVIARGAPYEP